MLKFSNFAVVAVLFCARLATSDQAYAELATFDVRTRPVSEVEIAGGAPVGTVFEFYTTTQNDIMSLAFRELSSNFYQHDLGSDSAPTPLQEYFSAISADSWFSTPGSTQVLGNGFRMQEFGEAETLWGDLNNIGALDNFQFGSLTVPHGQAASFSGRMSIVNEGPSLWDTYPLDFSVDSAGLFNFKASDPILPDYSKPSPPITPVTQPAPPTVDPALPVPPRRPMEPFVSVPPKLHEANFQVLSRPVTEQEMAAGAPAGTVFDLFATTETDMLSLSIKDLTGPVFQVDSGSDKSGPHSVFVEQNPALTADSWFTTPGDTMILGEGFSLQPNQDSTWGDLSQDGALTDFQFGRLTVPAGSETNLRGQFNIRGEHGPEGYHFDFSVDSNAAHVWEITDHVATPQPQPILPPSPPEPEFVGPTIPPPAVTPPVVTPPTARPPTTEPEPTQDEQPPVEETPVVDPEPVPEVVPTEIEIISYPVEPLIPLEIPLGSERLRFPTDVTLEDVLIPTIITDFEYTQQGGPRAGLQWALTRALLDPTDLLVDDLSIDLSGFVTTVAYDGPVFTNQLGLNTVAFKAPVATSALVSGSNLELFAFDSSAATSETAVPEPSGILILVASVLVLCAGRR